MLLRFRSFTTDLRQDRRANFPRLNGFNRTNSATWSRVLRSKLFLAFVSKHPYRRDRVVSYVLALSYQALVPWEALSRLCLGLVLITVEL